MTYTISHHPVHGAFVWTREPYTQKPSVLGKHVETISVKKFLKGRVQPVSDESLLETIRTQLRPGNTAFLDHGRQDGPMQVHIVNPNLSNLERKELEAQVSQILRHQAMEQPPTKNE